MAEAQLADIYAISSTGKHLLVASITHWLKDGYDEDNIDTYQMLMTPHQEELKMVLSAPAYNLDVEAFVGYLNEFSRNIKQYNYTNTDIKDVVEQIEYLVHSDITDHIYIEDDDWWGDMDLTSPCSHTMFEFDRLDEAIGMLKRDKDIEVPEVY